MPVSVHTGMMAHTEEAQALYKKHKNIEDAYRLAGERVPEKTCTFLWSWPGGEDEDEDGNGPCMVRVTTLLDEEELVHPAAYPVRRGTPGPDGGNVVIDLEKLPAGTKFLLVEWDY